MWSNFKLGAGHQCWAQDTSSTRTRGSRRPARHRQGFLCCPTEQPRSARRRYTAPCSRLAFQTSSPPPRDLPRRTQLHQCPLSRQREEQFRADTHPRPLQVEYPVEALPRCQFALGEERRPPPGHKRQRSTAEVSPKHTGLGLLTTAIIPDCEACHAVSSANSLGDGWGLTVSHQQPWKNQHESIHLLLRPSKLACGHETLAVSLLHHTSGQDT
jgi:hypothetical protein